MVARLRSARPGRVPWDTVGKIVERVVSDQLDADRLRGVIAIGCATRFLEPSDPS